MTLESSFYQTKSMEQRCGLKLSKRQIELYISLREGILDIDCASEIEATLKSLPVGQMSDQQLMAEIIRVTDESCLDKVIAAYPNIFSQK